jgi:hypothetical protein
VAGTTLRVRGKLLAVGTAALPIRFKTNVTSVTAVQHVSETGSPSNVTLKFAEFSKFSTGVSLACCWNGYVSIEDCLFADGQVGVSGCK